MHWTRSMRGALLCVALLLAGAAVARPQVDGETREARDRRMAWFRRARLGMFIHWGLYAVPAGEWNGKQIGGLGEWIMTGARIPVADYETLVQRFDPVKFDARAWVRAAKDAGMKYIVITSKHHDGFCLFDAHNSNYTVMATPFKRDILKELSAACKEAGIRLCFYYSIMDWHHPDYLPRREWDTRPVAGADYDRYVAYMKAQLKQLIEEYHPGILWFDGEWESTWTHERGLDLYRYVRSLDPTIIVNNRVDKGRQGMAGLTAGEQFAGDYGTPEQEVPSTGIPGVDWESCITINDTWGYKKNDHNWKSASDLIRMAIDIASKGGNLLLNVGPTDEGVFPDAILDRLKAMGRWMRVNGESIYGTTASPFPKPTWGRATAKGGTIYLHVFDWPSDGVLKTPPLSRTVVSASLLAAPKTRLAVENGADGVTVHVPAAAPDPIATVIVLRTR